ncbi:hypothetical protein DUI87_08650 [Hirundo rustica rustica]|uniref:Uncharacterized protein n=1 Tax=Hirundo rustica rustica TaxID=333673 RepID=A0A3M0KQH0_HIRRU|nr:hypothetical protein DUI87_08650 [Hirundo rustica rustica]
MGPETGLGTKLQQGPKSTQEMGLSCLSVTKTNLEKDTTMGCARGTRPEPTSQLTKDPTPVTTKHMYTCLGPAVDSSPGNWGLETASGVCRSTLEKACAQLPPRSL